METRNIKQWCENRLIRSLVLVHFKYYGTWLQLLQFLMECTNTPIISLQSIYCLKLLLSVIIVSSNNSDPESLDVHVIVIWVITYAICSKNLKKNFHLTSMFYPPPFCNQALRVLINKDTYFSFAFIWKYTTSWSVKKAYIITL